MAAERLHLDTDDIVRRYLAGDSEKKIADELGVSRTAIRPRLIQGGVHLRGRSEAETLKWNQRKDRPDYAEVVSRQCGAAHAATRGSTLSNERVCRTARTRYLRQIVTGVHGAQDDARLADALAILGVPVERQYAVDRYNLDLAVPELRVAVEVVASYPKPPYLETFRRRTEHLLNAGWAVIFVDVAKGPDRRPVMLDKVAEKLISRIDFARRDKSSHGHYLVIGRQGEPTAGLRKYLDGLPRVDHT